MRYMGKDIRDITDWNISCNEFFCVDSFIFHDLIILSQFNSWNSPIKFTIHVSWWSSNIRFRIHSCPSKVKAVIPARCVMCCVILNLFLAWVVSATIRSISARFPDIFSNSICFPLWPGKGYQVAFSFKILKRKNDKFSQTWWCW